MGMGKKNQLKRYEQKIQNKRYNKTHIRHKSHGWGSLKLERPDMSSVKTTSFDASTEWGGVGVLKNKNPGQKE